jgi:IPT/TIG domain-containing protein
VLPQNPVCLSTLIGCAYHHFSILSAGAEIGSAPQSTRVRKMLTRLLRIMLVTISSLAYAVPTLTSISPTSVIPGMTMTLTGSGFGATRGSGSVTFFAPGDTVGVSNYISWSDTQIVVTVPNRILPGVVYVTHNGTSSGQIAYTTIAPTLTSISPTAIKPGITMTLTGSGFGPTQGVGSVTFFAPGDTVGARSFTSWSDTQIVLTVPSLVAAWDDHGVAKWSSEQRDRVHDNCADVDQHLADGHQAGNNDDADGNGAWANPGRGLGNIFGSR